MDGRWHHYAFTRDAEAMELVFYVDGERLGEPVGFDQLPTGGGRGMLYMGSDVSGISGYELSGALDEVCLFNTILDDDEIWEIYDTESCPFETVEPDDPDDTGDKDTGDGDSGVVDTGASSTDGETGADGGVQPNAEGDASLGACGCSSSGVRAGSAWLWLGLVALFRSRRRKG